MQISDDHLLEVELEVVVLLVVEVLNVVLGARGEEHGAFQVEGSVVCLLHVKFFVLVVSALVYPPLQLQRVTRVMQVEQNVAKSE